MDCASGWPLGRALGTSGTSGFFPPPMRVQLEPPIAFPEKGRASGASDEANLPRESPLGTPGPAAREAPGPADDASEGIGDGDNLALPGAGVKGETHGGGLSV
mmetsp:Transcript_39452/g.88256  ORF Transcript_39452/g.88256 Transcript_39452/m.88256 type:complete len:103 (+) Transcript_39452:502-810(+)